MPKSYRIGEGTNIKQYFRKNKAQMEEGDKIERVAQNQMNYEAYKVVIEKNKKTYKLIYDYDIGMKDLENMPKSRSSSKSRSRSRSKGGTRKRKNFRHIV